MNCFICYQEINSQDHYHLHPRCFKRLFGTESPTEFIEFKRLSTTLHGSIDNPEDSSRDAQFHGHYPKFSARLEQKRYIIKFGKSSSYPLLAEAEAISNVIAELLGIAIAKPFALISYKNRKCFVVRDFLDARRPQNLLHLWDIWPQDGSQKTPYYLETLIELINTHLSFREAAQCIRLILFDYLIGNGDRHRNNIAIIESGQGKRKLAPFYDNVTDLGLEDPQFLDVSMKWHPQMKIELASGKTDIGDYCAIMEHLGFKQSILGFQRKLQSQLPTMMNIIDSFPVNKNLKACLIDLIKRRSEDIFLWK